MPDQDFSESFDPPIIEPVKGFGDVKFARADMDYWAAWAAALKQKRAAQYAAELERNAGLSAAAKADMKARAQAGNIQLYELLDMQYIPDGIKKLLLDGYVRAGGDPAGWPAIVKRIGPVRQQAIASDICSEPRPGTEELRQALRDVLRKAGKAAPSNLTTMSDEDLIAAVKEIAGPLGQNEGDSTSAAPPGSSADISDAIPAS